MTVVYLWVWMFGLKSLYVTALLLQGKNLGIISSIIWNSIQLSDSLRYTGTSL